MSSTIPWVAASTGAMSDNALVAWLLVEPFLLKMGVITPETFKERYQQMFVEMLADDFCALWYYLTVWGITPRTTSGEAGEKGFRARCSVPLWCIM